MADLRDERDERDPLLARIVDELSALPPADDRAVARIVALASTQRRTRLRRHPSVYMIGVAVAAGLTALVLVRPDRSAGREGPAVGATEARRTAGVLREAGADARALEDAPIVTQFVVDLPHARTVSLVGDFNDWNPAATPLVRHPASGRWTAEVPLTPGRHRYAYMMNDSVLTLDPEAPRAVDPDFGSPSSVILVGVR